MAKKAAQAITSGPGTRAAAPEMEAALHELVGRAKEHKKFGEGQARAGRAHERSCAAVCRCVVRLERSLTPEQRAALFDEAVRRRLLSKGSRGDEVTKLARLACGAGESKSVVSRIAAVARHLAESGRDVEAVLPESARFWAVYEELRPTFAARRGKAAAEPLLSIRLEDGFVERIRAGAAGTLRVAWDLAAARPVVTEIVVGEPGGPGNSPRRAAESGGGGSDGAVDDPTGGVVPAVESDRSRPGLERADQAEAASPEGEHEGGSPPPPGGVDGAPCASSADGGAGAFEEAPGATGTSTDGPSDKTEAGLGKPGHQPPLVIAFAAHVAKDDPDGLAILKSHGSFTKRTVNGRERTVWMGPFFDGLDALVSAHGGRHVGP